MSGRLCLCTCESAHFLQFFKKEKKNQPCSSNFVYRDFVDEAHSTDLMKLHLRIPNSLGWGCSKKSVIKANSFFLSLYFSLSGTDVKCLLYLWVCSFCVVPSIPAVTVSSFLVFFLPLFCHFFSPCFPNSIFLSVPHICAMLCNCLHKIRERDLCSTALWSLISFSTLGRGESFVVSLSYSQSEEVLNANQLSNTNPPGLVIQPIFSPLNTPKFWYLGALLKVSHGMSGFPSCIQVSKIRRKFVCFFSGIFQGHARHFL